MAAPPSSDRASTAEAAMVWISFILLSSRGSGCAAPFRVREPVIGPAENDGRPLNRMFAAALRRWGAPIDKCPAPSRSMPKIPDRMGEALPFAANPAGQLLPRGARCPDHPSRLCLAHAALSRIHRDGVGSLSIVRAAMPRRGFRPALTRAASRRVPPRRRPVARSPDGAAPPRGPTPCRHCWTRR